MRSEPSWAGAGSTRTDHHATSTGPRAINPRGFFLPVSQRRDTVPRMIDDLDILRAANILVKRYGTDAAIEAARRADELLTTPAEGERVN